MTVSEATTGSLRGSDDDVLLRLDRLSLDFETPEGPFEAVRNVSLSVKRGEILGVVGESGSGKTATFMAALSQLPRSASTTGQAWFEGQDLLALRPGQRRKILGREIGVIFQEPVATLDPIFRVGKQLEEVLTQHEQLSRAELHQRQIELLKATGVPDPERRLKQYPFQLSGGLCQRIGIALAFAHNPRLIIADEPTTALDLTVQAQILRVLLGMVRERDCSLVLISHDLGVIAQLADRVVVMYGGMVVEDAPVQELFDSPQHPYTRGLLASVLRHEESQERLKSIPGRVPSRYDRMPGCRFAPRCELAQDRCTTAIPELVQVQERHAARCVLVEAMPNQATADGAPSVVGG